MWAEGSVSWNAQVVLQQLVAGFAAPIHDPQTLLSMEIFSSSSLESSDRAAFLTAISALEPLVKEQALGPAVDAFVEGCCLSLRTTALLINNIELLLKAA